MSLDSSQLLSRDSSALAGLSAEQRQRLTDVLDHYLLALERGAPPVQAELLAQHQDLAELLRLYFRSLEELHDLAAGFSAMPGEPLAPCDAARRIGDFELVREIGRGGMGVVYEARQISLHRRVAVKLLPFASVLDSRQIARFKHEAQAAAQLHHPHIVPVFAIGAEQGVHFYAMQLIEGQPLDVEVAELRRRREVRKTFGAVPPANTGGNSCLTTAADNRQEYFDAVARLGIQAAEALHAAHEFGIVHRDVKPSNLLLEPGGKLWVTDFGLARIAREAALTRTGDLVGTLRYMSPEQAAGHSAQVDQRSDIYSLGVTLYELACLRPAFPDESGPELLRKIESQSFARPRQIRPAIPAELETVILKAMAADREDRYPTAQQLADDLRRVLEGQATLAQPPTLVDRLARWERRHRRLVTIAAGLLLVAVAGLTASTLLVARENRRAEQQIARADRHFRNARQVVDCFGVQLSERLAQVPGTEGMRHELLQAAARFYATFADEADNDPQLKMELAAAFGILGRQCDEFGANQEAIDAHGQAVRLYREVSAAEGAGYAVQRQLAVALNNLGLALARAGKREPARERFHDAIGLQQALISQSPHDLGLRNDLATSLVNLGRLQRKAGETSAAQGSLRSAAELLQRLIDANPHDRAARRKLAAVNNHLAATYVASEPDTAIRLYERALKLQTDAEGQPDEPTLEREIGLTHCNLGAAHSSVGDWDRSRTEYRQAIKTQQRLLAREPANLTYQRDLAVSWNNLGLVLSRSGQPDEAAMAFRAAVGLYESLVKQSADDAADRSSLASIQNNLNLVLDLGETAAVNLVN